MMSRTYTFKRSKETKNKVVYESSALQTSLYLPKGELGADEVDEIKVTIEAAKE
jgi:hypothetical protein